MQMDGTFKKTQTHTSFQVLLCLLDSPAAESDQFLECQVQKLADKRRKQPSSSIDTSSTSTLLTASDGHRAGALMRRAASKPQLMLGANTKKTFEMTRAWSQRPHVGIRKVRGGVDFPTNLGGGRATCARNKASQGPLRIKLHHEDLRQIQMWRLIKRPFTWADHWLEER